MANYGRHPRRHRRVLAPEPLLGKAPSDLGEPTRLVWVHMAGVGPARQGISQSTQLIGSQA
jgi:hypothetical protein